MSRVTARALAQASLARGDVTGWFETLYQQADGTAGAIPWAELCVNPNLAQWLARNSIEQNPIALAGKRALVVGCGLGDDAEELAHRGCVVTAFDIAPTAIQWCRQRFAESQVNYQVADALSVPDDWQAAFDLVVEIFTLQVLPPEPRAVAATQLASCVAPDGTLLAVARAREPHEPTGEMPWPLTRTELENAFSPPLALTSLEDYLDDETPRVRRFRATYRRDP